MEYVEINGESVKAALHARWLKAEKKVDENVPTEQQLERHDARNMVSFYAWTDIQLKMGNFSRTRCF